MSKDGDSGYRAGQVHVRRDGVLRTDFHRAQDRIGLMVYRVCQSRTLVSMNRSSGAARVQDLTGDLRSLPLIDLPWADSLSVDPQANSR
jgi:hypothetical protein